MIVLVWSREYTTFTLTGSEAFVVFPKNAKLSDGAWDLDIVERDTRILCPHCGGHIRDDQKTVMDRDGRWEPSASSAKGYRGYHLSSLYAASAETTIGKLARKFLQAKRSLLGLQGFVNGDLAEPWAQQDRQAERVELIKSKLDATSEWNKLLTVDCQAKAPHFWYVVRAWSKSETEGVEAGSVDTWEEVRSIQERHGIIDSGVIVDSGFGAKSLAGVYAECARHCEPIMESQSEIPVLVGWIPAKGMPVNKVWKDSETGLDVPWFRRKVDPFSGSADAGLAQIRILEFSGEYFKDILDELRRKQFSLKWSVSESMATSEYWKHMDAEIKSVVYSKRTGKTQYIWTKRSKYWPDHIRDCEIMQLAGAAFLGMLDVNAVIKIEHESDSN